MGEAKLTSRERVERMFERREADRIPRNDTYWGETIQRWRSEGLDGDAGTVLAMLGNDFQRLCWSWPAPFPGQRTVVSEDERTIVILDQFGQTTRTWKGRSGTPEHLGWECTSREVWEQRFKPAMLESSLHVDVEAVKRSNDHARQHELWSCLVGVESFEATRKLMGDEVTLVAMATDPDWVADVSRVHTDLVLRDFQAAWDAGVRPDGVWIYGDMAYNHGTMCSPAMYRDIIWPDHKRLADWAHEHGLRFIYHTDGDIRRVMDLYVEAGFDCLQPLEAKAHVDVRELCPQYGDRLAFFGNIDVMVMATNDRDLIDHELRTKLAAGMATRGYAYHSDHSVPPSVAWETYQFIIERVDHYGWY